MCAPSNRVIHLVATNAKFTALQQLALDQKAAHRGTGYDSPQ